MNPRFTPYTERHGEFVSECTPSFTLEDHIASLRDGDPEKWARLNRDWETK